MTGGRNNVKKCLKFGATNDGFTVEYFNHPHSFINSYLAQLIAITNHPSGCGGGGCC